MAIKYAFYHQFAGDKMENFFIDKNGLDMIKHYQNAYDISKAHSFGALSNFSGIVRDDEGATALSFDIYEPILKKWFEKWEIKAQKIECLVYFAHSVGDVIVGESSYFAATMSKHRRKSLELLDEFVEDFKKNAPIWKYDIINNQRKYAFQRSFELAGAGAFKD